MTDWADATGILGAIISIYYYARVQLHREFAKKMEFSFGNFIGSILILVSLAVYWNTAAIITNTVWGIVSLYGMYRCWKYTKQKKVAATPAGIQED